MSLRIVLMADEQRIMREALRALLEREGFDVVGEAWVGLEATRIAADLQPDVTVLDLVLPIRTGLDAARFMAEASPQTRFHSAFSASVALWTVIFFLRRSNAWSSSLRMI